MIAFREQFESGQERIPTKYEVMEIISRLTGDERIIPIREKSDDLGLYLLEIKIEDSETKENIHFEYRRKGTYPEGSTASTVINVEYYDGTMCIGGSNVADFDSATGEWKMTQ